ncbi:MAG: class I SAM-dependent methyltransferase [Bacteroidota bacterium]
MQPEESQWEQIFKSAGHVLPEPAPVAIQFTERLKERGVRSVLDLGCGSGRHVVHMSGKGLHVTGADNAPTALKLTGEWLRQEHLDADLVLADMRRPLPFERDSFDALLSTQVIHHARLATVRETTREIQRVVYSGGTILISVPARREIAMDGEASEEIEPNTFVPTGGSEKGLPHHLFTPAELRDLFPLFEVQDLRVIDDRIISLIATKK